MMTFDKAVELLSEDEGFRATVYAMNTLLLRHRVYEAHEFEELFVEHAENALRKAKSRQGASRETAVSIP